MVLHVYRGPLGDWSVLGLCIFIAGQNSENLGFTGFTLSLVFFIVLFRVSLHLDKGRVTFAGPHRRAEGGAFYGFPPQCYAK